MFVSIFVRSNLIVWSAPSRHAAAVLRRGEKLEDMAERSENIAIEANQFKRNAVQLKKTMWWRNMKLWLLIIGVIIIVIIIIIIAVCGIRFKCGS